MSLKNRIIKKLGGYTFDYIAKMAAEVVSMREELNNLLLASEPTADVEEVKHGQWLDVEDKNGNQVKICSHCAREGCYESTYEESFDYDYNENCYCDGYDEHREYISTRYCPYCGTKMDL